jgi:cell division protein FtsB
VTATSAPAPRFTAEQVKRRRTLALRLSVALVVVIGLLFVVVFPLQSWLDQRASIGASERRLEVLRRERSKLEAEAKHLRSDAIVEQIARSRYGMVRPGEQPYAVVPESAPTTSTTLPSAP